MTLLVFVCVLLAGAAGCSKRHRIQVESDTCWSGRVNDDQFIDGCGNSSYQVIGTMRCVRVHLVEPTGSLRIRIDDHPWVSAVDQYGYVQACN